MRSVTDHPVHSELVAAGMHGGYGGELAREVAPIWIFCRFAWRSPAKTGSRTWANAT
jgi:hypothetical protein